MTPLLRVIVPGMHTTVQDLGHHGRERYGVAAGGAMDPVSLRLANTLVRNHPDAPALEITLTGPTLEVLADTVFAICGADIPLTVDGRSVGSGHSFRAARGSVIAFGRRRHGARAYLAVDGGLTLEGHYRQGRLYHDRTQRIVAGEMIGRFDARSMAGSPLIHLADAGAWDYTTPSTLRVIVGPHWGRLSANGRESFLGSEFTAGIDSSRAGIRLAGPAAEFAEGEIADILSESTPLGTIQLPASGQPIILTADRPTTGGYAKIATVITVDIPRAAQLAPGDSVRFELVKLEEAHKALAALETKLRLIERVATWPR